MTERYGSEASAPRPGADGLTANGMVEPARLYQSPYVDRGHGDVIFPKNFEVIVAALRDINAHAVPGGAA